MIDIIDVINFHIVRYLLKIVSFYVLRTADGCVNFDSKDIDKYYSAFTVAELRELLEEYEGEECSTEEMLEMLDCKSFMYEMDMERARGKITEADCRAKKLIYLLKKK